MYLDENFACFTEADSLNSIHCEMLKIQLYMRNWLCSWFTKIAREQFSNSFQSKEYVS